MGAEKSGRLVILSGPSCVGKSPLVKAFKKLYPDAAASIEPLILYNDRQPRPGEEDGVDYHFRSTGEIAGYRKKPNFVVKEVRNDLQALDVVELKEQLRRSDVLYEGNPFFGVELIHSSKLLNVPKLSVFLAPISRLEIDRCLAAESTEAFHNHIVKLMKGKQLRRAGRMWGKASDDQLADAEVRARSAYAELRQAHHFDFVIVNHDGEDSDHWLQFTRPIGDAGRALDLFAALIRGQTPCEVENWEAGLLPQLAPQ